MMKAIICSRYGPPNVLQIQEVPKPVPNSNQVLVKIIASTINSGDVKVRSLDVKGYMKTVMRIVLGISKPRKPILGTVFSGIIVNKGNKVSNFENSYSDFFTLFNRQIKFRITIIFIVDKFRN